MNCSEHKVGKSPWRSPFLLRHGQALLLGVLLAILSGLFVLESAPFGGAFSAQLQPPNASETTRIEKLLDAWQASDGVRDAHCALAESDESTQTAQLNCRFDGPDEDSWFEHLNEILEQLEGVKPIESYSVSMQTDPGQAPGWSLVTVAVFTLALATFLGRSNHWPNDIRRSGLVLGRRPWLLLLPLLVWLVVSNLGMAVLTRLIRSTALVARRNPVDVGFPMRTGT